MKKLFLKVVLIMLTTNSILLANSQYEQNDSENVIKSNLSNKSKVFIREYTYNASEDDSKNSSRKKAIKQLKSILSEEVGTHIESSLNMETTVKNGVSNKYVKSEINSLSASITKLKILDEKWNGITYYIKASVKIDEEQTMILLIEAIKSKASEKDVKRLNKILKEQNGHLDKSYSKIQALQKKLVAHEINNQASKRELKNLKNMLLKYTKEKKEYQSLITKHKRELDNIKKIMAKVKTRLSLLKEKVCLIDEGMTKKEVINALGKPDFITTYSGISWNYSIFTVYFHHATYLTKYVGRSDLGKMNCIKK